MVTEVKNKRSPFLSCLFALVAIGLLSVCCLGGLGISGYYIYSSRTFTLNDILNIANLGPSEFQLVNLSDGSIDVELRGISEEDGSTYHVESASMEPFDMAALRSVSRGRYELIIEVHNGLPQSETCYLRVGGGSNYHVAIVPEGIAIVLEGREVSSVQELNMASSSLCGR